MITVKLKPSFMSGNRVVLVLEENLMYLLNQTHQNLKKRQTFMMVERNMVLCLKRKNPASLSDDLPCTEEECVLTFPLDIIMRKKMQPNFQGFLISGLKDLKEILNKEVTAIITQQMVNILNKTCCRWAGLYQKEHRGDSTRHKKHFWTNCLTVVQNQETKLQQKKLNKECINNLTPEITFQWQQLSLILQEGLPRRRKEKSLKMMWLWLKITSATKPFFVIK